MVSSESDINIIGSAHPNYLLIVVDEYLHEVPIGCKGELLVGGPGVSRGYLNQPELTNSKFIEYEGYGRVYRTGDVVSYTRNGELCFYGRRDDQVKHKGVRIELSEIENIALQSKYVKGAVCMIREDKLVLYYTLLLSEVTVSVDETNNISSSSSSSSSNIETESESGVLRLRNAVESYMRYQCPSTILPECMMYLESFPLNSNGKVDKKLLPKPLVFDLAVSDNDDAFISDEELKLLNIFKEVLGVNLSSHSNFFSLGGNSLKVIVIVSIIGTKQFHYSICKGCP